MSNPLKCRSSAIFLSLAAFAVFGYLMHSHVIAVLVAIILFGGGFLLSEKPEMVDLTRNHAGKPRI